MGHNSIVLFFVAIVTVVGARSRLPAVPATTPHQKPLWSLRPLADPPVPEVEDPSGADGAIDRFLLRKLERRGWGFAPEASRETWIRRATFDLLGFPPTPEEADAFVEDRAPGAFARLVDRLLASPHYGERWGRHWLDVVRYADTAGCSSDYPVPSAYRYRNYVIDAFNSDKPYDDFVREQVAGDLLESFSEDERYEKIIATGYLAISRRFGSGRGAFHLTLEDTIDNLGKTFLGLSLGCARCHDHKYDPVSMVDYYSLYGIFSSTVFAYAGKEHDKIPKDFVPLVPVEQVAAIVARDAELTKFDREVSELRIRARKTEPGEAKKQARREYDEAKRRRRDAIRLAPWYPRAYAVAEGKFANAKIHLQGNPHKKGEEVSRGFLQAFGGQRLVEGAAGSGRRELADWLTRASRHLLARVVVNRLWQHHFGRGLVGTPNDFGARGEAPSHPELLDYLAGRLVASGWSLKAVHREILVSRAYRMASEREDAAVCEVADPDNRLLWKFSRRRLSAEEIRDALLFVSRELDLSQGKEHPFPPSYEWTFTQHFPFVARYETRRRSVYLMQQRIRRHPILESFDGADPNATTGTRPLSTTAIQALFHMNSPFVHARAHALAEGLAARDVPAGEQIRKLHRDLFGRSPTIAEIAAGQDYLRQVGAATGSATGDSSEGTEVWESYVRVLLGTNEFLFVD